jgi:hypothetical protein
MNLKQAKRLRASLGTWRTPEGRRTQYRAFKLRMKREGIVILRDGSVTTRALLNVR